MDPKIFKKCDAQSLNVMAYIRVRPLGPKEKKSGNLEFSKREVIIKSSAESCRNNKTLTFDRVFEDDVKQVNVYKTVVKPMINEVLQGYNCTVFAYGQTGTGKTYTMTGEQNDLHGSWEEDMHAGIIPRTMEDIFTELSKQPAEYQVSVSYLELYNEKLRSLLNTAGEDVNIQLIDGLESGVVLRGLVPTPVKNKEDAFQFLQEGAEKKQMASTNMNINSSRSHTIFTINIKIKESMPGEKEDVLRIGKLHLVDLAGSENVSKSGAAERTNKVLGVNKRLAEASNINKSLLTLGRVITSLTENNPHIPYRESKLTRFLRDSLGGRTKTCIIGTISPAQGNIEETESTLNYAYKARSIKNKPEKNRTISKKEFMQVASEEITKLRRDLEAVRQGDGFYVSQETHKEMSENMMKLENQVKLWSDRYGALNEEYEQNKAIFNSMTADYDDKCAEYDELEKIFQSESEKFKEKLNQLNKEVLLREYLLQEYHKSEQTLTEQAKTCKSVLEALIEQSNKLHDKIDRKTASEDSNIRSLHNFKNSVIRRIEDFQSGILLFNRKESEFLNEMAQFTINVNDIICEEIVSTDSELSRFSRTMAVFDKKSEEIYRSLEKVVIDNVSDTNNIVQENLKKEISGLKSLVTSIVDPAHERFQQVKKNMEALIKEKEIMLTNFSEMIEHIKEEQMESLADIDKVIKSIEDECDHLEQMLVKNVTSANETKKNADRAVAIMKQLGPLMKELQPLIENQQQSADENIIHFENASKNVHGITSLATAEMSEIKLKQATMHENWTSGSKKIHCDDKELHNKISDVVNAFDIEEKILVEDIKTNIDQLCTVSEQHGQRVHDKNLNTMETVKELGGQQEARIKKVQQEVQNHRKTVLSITKNKGDIVSDVLRKEHSRVLDNLKAHQQHEDTLKGSVEEIETEIDGAKYTLDTPSGQTPSRVTKDQLEYPRKFHATASRETLIEEFNNQEVFSIPHPNIEVPRTGQKQKGVASERGSSAESLLEDDTASHPSSMTHMPIIHESAPDFDRDTESLDKENSPGKSNKKLKIGKETGQIKNRKVVRGVLTDANRTCK